MTQISKKEMKMDRIEVKEGRKHSQHCRERRHWGKWNRVGRRWNSRRRLRRRGERRPDASNRRAETTLRSLPWQKKKVSEIKDLKISHKSAGRGRKWPKDLKWIERNRIESNRNETLKIGGKRMRSQRLEVNFQKEKKKDKWCFFVL